jgi:hypothetical protein
MGRYGPLPAHLRTALEKIQPSVDSDLSYYPCRVRLRDGRGLDTVYIEPDQSYFKQWGIWPEDDRHKSWIRIEDVAEVEDSPTRLPARFADEIYRHGESGMGYTIFTVVFAGGLRQACGTGNAVDFIQYPPGKGPADVVAVIPHEGRNAPQIVSAPGWYWCLYSEDAK